MAFVLSNQENIDLLLFLVNLAIALGTIAIVLWLLLWLRLKNLEKVAHLKRRPLPSRFINLNSQKPPTTLLARPITANRPNNTFAKNLGRNSTVNITTIRNPRANHLDRPNTYTKSLKQVSKISRQSINLRWRWLLAIAIACMIGIAIALLQLGNSLIGSEYVTLIWMLIGLGLVISAAYVL